MTIPVATTTIKVEEAAEAEPGEGRTWATIASGVRAVIGSPSGSARPADGGGASTVVWRLIADPVVITDTSRVTDETTGTVYEVAWIASRPGLGLDHTVAGLTLARGAAA